MQYSQLSLRRTPLGPALSVRLIESHIEGVKKAGTNSKCPFYRGVRLIEVSVKRESTVVLNFFFPARLSGLSPLLGDDDNETLANVTAVEWDFDDESFDVITDEAKEFISKLLVKNSK